PSTRRLAKEKGVDLSRVEGTGPGGRVTDEDVERAAGEGKEGEKEAEEDGEKVERAAETFGSSGRRFEPMDVDFGKWGEVERKEMSGTRRSIARRMERSKYTAPHVTATDEADVSDLVEVREKERENSEEEGVHLTFMPFVIKAVISALKDYPLLNASLDEETGEIVKKNYYNIGVAVATDDGLLVPNVKEADEKSIFEIAGEVNDKAERARERELDLEEMRGGTFTISNWGSIGGKYGTPIINYPEVGVLGMGVIEEKPVAVDGEVVVRKVMPLSLTFDHRVVDGAYAAQFMNEVVKHLEDPDLLMMD
ncbi:MAG: dihydrolipoamide acetyltransferase family protein, partial [Candidatus Nanohaloarchaea archaeon]